MKFAGLARPGLIVLGIAATALLGFAAGVAAARADVGSAPAKNPPRQRANRLNESGVPKSEAT